MRGRKTLIAAGSVAGLVVGGAIGSEAALPTAIGTGFLIWLLTWRAKEPVPPDRSLGFTSPPARFREPGTMPPHPVAVRPTSRPERSARAEQAELEHLYYAAGVVTEALGRGLVDRETADRLRALIEERRHRAMKAALAPAAESPAAPVLPAPPAPPPTPAPITVPEPVPPPRPSAVPARARRIKELIVSDVAVHGLAYLGVLLLFSGAFGFTLFSFNTVRVGLRPVAEIGMPGMLLGSAWFLRRRGAPVVATGLGLIGGLLLPVMVFASFVDGVAFPPEVHGTALALTLAAVAIALALAYAAYTVRQPGASLRYLVAPMVWVACWAVGLLLDRDARAGIDLRRWTAGQLAFVSVAVAVTAAVHRLWPRFRLSQSIRTSAVPGIAIAYALAIALAAAEGWPASPVIVAGLATMVAVELLAGPATGPVPVALLQAAILGITASALMPALGYATGGAVTAFAFLGLLEWEEVRRRGQIARAVSGIGVLVGLGLTMAGPWASVAAFGGVTAWAHLRRAIRFPSVTRGEVWALEGGAALLPLGAAWGLLQVWPDGRALMALAGMPLAAAISARALRRQDFFYAWWVPAAAASVIAATVVVRSAEPAEQLAPAAGLCALAIALSPRWPTARVWGTAAATAWTAELAFEAADAALRYRVMAWSGAGLALVVVASARRRSRVAGHLAAVGTSLALAGLAVAPTELARLVTLGLWVGVWLVTVVDLERGGAPVVDLILRASRGMRARGVERVIAAVPAAVLVTSLPFLATAAGRHIGPIADHRSWSGVILSLLAVGYSVVARSLVSRRPLSTVLATSAFVLSAVGIAVAAPDPWPSIEAVSALIVAVMVLGGGLRRPIMTRVAWAASGVLVLLLAGRAGVPAKDLPWVLLGWGAALMVGGLALDDIRSGRRAPGQGLRESWLAPPVIFGALAVPVGLAFAFMRTPGLIGSWSLAAAGLYLLVALQLRAGSVSAVSYALLVVGVGALTRWSVLERPWTGGVWATGLVASSLVLARVKPSRDPWVRWDLAPLVIAHGVAVVGLARSLDVGAVPATWSSIGAVSLALGGLRRNPLWAVAGAIVLGVGAGAAGPGWLALALGVYSLVAVTVAIRSRGSLRLAMQATSMALAAASWSQLALWAGWSGSQTAMLTAFISATVAVVSGAVARWARLPADWAANLAGLSVAGGLAVVGLSSAPYTGVDPHTGAALLALVTASLSVGAGLAARPLGVHALREASAILVAGAGLLLGYGLEVEAGPLTGWWAATAIASTLVVLGLWRARPSSPWIRPLGLLGASGSVVTIVVAASALPRRDLLEVALSVAGMQTAAMGIALRRPEPLYPSPVLFCGAWLLFASEALAGEAQWFTVPIGIALLTVVGIGRAARRHELEPLMPPELLGLEYLGMALVVGDGLVESITTSPARGLFALAFGVGLAVWGALTKVRRRAVFGAGAAVLAVALMVGGPIARLAPRITGPALWVVQVVAGVVLIAIATGLERGRAKVAAAMRRLDTLTEDWE
jgi:hypothetical protein